MFSQLSYYIFSILILLIFTSTSVYSVACGYSEQICSNSQSTWCCPSYETCGSYYESCYNPTYPTPSSDISPALIIVIVIVTLVICITFLSCCIRSQQQPQQHIRSTYNPNAQRVAYPYQQQSSRQASRVVHVRPVYNVGAAPTIHSTYEAPPPSYEAATRNLPPKYPSASLEPGIATIEEMNSRV